MDEWPSIAALPPLGADEVQVWRTELPSSEEFSEPYIGLLSPPEQARAARFRAGEIRARFVVARATLRLLLGNCLAVAPKQVAITLSSFGKPETPGVFFNVSHSASTILIALCRGHRAGVDIEHLSREVDPLEIAKNFSPAEYRALTAIGDPGELRRAFFRCWTRKEAVLKADGRGLSLPLDSFVVQVGGVAAAAPVELALDGGRYFVTDLTLDEGGTAAAAVAVASPEYVPRLLSFPLDWIATQAT